MSSQLIAKSLCSKTLRIVFAVALSVPINANATLYSGSKADWIVMWLGITFVLYVLPSVLNILLCLRIGNKINSVVGCCILFSSILGTLAFNISPIMGIVRFWESIVQFCNVIAFVGLTHLILNLFYLIFRIVFRVVKGKT